MATTLSGTTTFNVTMNYVNALDLANVTQPIAENWQQTWTNGTGSNQIDLMWNDQRTVTAAAEDLDFAGVLTNPVTGAAMTFVKINGIFIKNNSTSTGEVLLVGGDANGLVNWVGAANDIIKVGPSGVFALWQPIDGYTVTAATGDILQIDPGANTITYNIVVIGRSA